MDLVAAPGTKVIVTMEHNSKNGAPKILSQCSLPLTGKNCVNMIVTEKAVFNVCPEQGLTLIEVAEGIEMQELVASTGCIFKIADDVKVMQQIEV